MINFYNSGLYKSDNNKKTFYKKYKIEHESALGTRSSQEFLNCLLKRTKYNLPLLAEYYHTVNSLNYVDIEDLCKKLRKEFVTMVLSFSLSWRYYYYMPCLFDEKIALECDLVPFQFDGLNLLSVGTIDTFHSLTKLEAYQLLTHGTIDKEGNYFNNYNSSKGDIVKILNEKTAEKILKKLAEFNAEKEKTTREVLKKLSELDLAF